MAIDQTHKHCSRCGQATMHYRKATNHILHLLVTLFLCGFWLPVWLLCSIQIGGWRCQTCGYKGPLLARMAAPVLVVILFLIVISTLASRVSRRETTYKGTPVIAVEPRGRPAAQPVDSTVPGGQDGNVVEPAGQRPTKLPAAPPAEKKIDPPEPKIEVVPPANAHPFSRTWVDASGTHTIEAEYKGVAFGNVKLKKEDGTVIEVPLEKLSEEDRAWLKKRK